MNFDSEATVDVLLGRLLAFVVMFEKKVRGSTVRSSC